MRVRCSKGDHFCQGAVVSRVSSSPGVVSVREGGAVALMVQLLVEYMSLAPDAPLASYLHDDGIRSVWTQAQATRALREIVATAGMPPNEFALHSLRIGGATQISASHIAKDVLQREGRWRSDAYKVYVRNMGKRVGAVSDALAAVDAGGRKQPGHGSAFGICLCW